MQTIEAWAEHVDAVCRHRAELAGHTYDGSLWVERARETDRGMHSRVWCLFLALKDVDPYDVAEAIGIEPAAWWSRSALYKRVHGRRPPKAHGDL